MIDSTITLFSIALGLGMLHALDADHLLTITGLSAQQSQWQKVTRYSLHWVMGHSFSLIGIGLSVFLLGVTFNNVFSQYAEFIVAIVLAMIGLRLLLNIRSSHSCSKSNVISAKHSTQKAFAIGGIHGVAGTASILAIIPITKINDPYIAIGYLFIFSIGILLSMLIFGGVLRHTVIRLIEYSPHCIKVFQICAGVLAVAVAIHLMYTSVS